MDGVCGRMDTMKKEDIQGRFGNRKPGLLLQDRRFATLLPLIEVDGELHILFEVRSENVAQPGEISFPGGAMEGEETPVECAVRETCEEVGIRPEQIEILGQNDTMINGFRRVVYNFIGFLHVPFGDLVMNRDESRELFTIPLDYFLNTEPIVHMADMWEHTRGDFPYEEVHYPREASWPVGTYEIVFYDYEKDPPLWGLTAAFMRRFTAILKEERP